MKHIYTKNIGIGRLFIPFLAFMLFSAPLQAQTAGRLEEMLKKPALHWEDAAIFALGASGQAALSDSGEAFDYARSREWLPQKARMGDPARLDGLALLLMGAFDLKGGIFYSIAKNPHYAYRELVYKEVIQGRTDPDMLVSGEEFLFILSRVLSLVEDIEGEARRRAAHEALAAEISKQLAGITDISVEVIAEGVTIRFYDIQFNADSSVLAEPGKAKLREVTEALKTRYIRGKRILVSGHTALAGVETERQRISVERAQAAASYLVELGFRRENQITVRGFGADRPLADNNTPEGMARNRRVEITILDD